MTSSNSNVDTTAAPCHGDEMDGASPAIQNNKYGFHAADTKARAQQPALQEDPGRLSELIISKALQQGADQAGVCKFDKSWLYNPHSLDKYGATVKFSSVIVAIIAMDAEFFRAPTSPAVLEETMRGYDRMKSVAVKLGDHIASLGYNALSSGNDTSASIPPAIDAGLGTLGRNGLLINEQFGPCLRICKVFTDMPLKVGAAKRPLLADICRNCSICAAECPANAIEENGASPAGDVWLIDKKSCGAYWNATKRQCAACISECPATWRNRRT